MLLSIKQAAERIQVGQTTVRGLCQQGKLRYFRIGLGRGVIRIDEGDLEEYLKGTMVGPEKAQPLPPRERFKHLRVG